MTYYEIESEPFGLGYTVNGPLEPGFTRGGWVNGQPLFVEVLNSDSVLHNNEPKILEGGAVVFDRRRFFKRRHALVYLNPDQVMSLEVHRDASEETGVPGAFQDFSVGIFRLALEQVGIRKPGKRSIGEKIVGILSVGLTEKISR
jgi:hypothetical protein